MGSSGVTCLEVFSALLLEEESPFSLGRHLQHPLSFGLW